MEGLPAELRHRSLQTLFVEKISCQSHRHTGMVRTEKDRSRAGRGTKRVPSLNSSSLHDNNVPRCNEVLDHSPDGFLKCGAFSSLPGLVCYTSRQYTPMLRERETSLGDGVDNDNNHLHSYTTNTRPVSDGNCHVFL